MTTPLDRALAAPEPIALEELAARAALLTRVDRKYVLPTATVGELVGVLAPRARVLEIAGRRGFGYATTYFDTPELHGYRAAAHGRRRRFKVRTRRYDLPLRVPG